MDTDLDKAPEEAGLRLLSAAFRRRGLRVTPQRVAIYQELEKSPSHPSAVMIHKNLSKDFPTMSLATVSNTLLLFGDIGLARIVEFTGDPRRFDPDLRPHHHFRCRACGRIVDFFSDAYDSLEPPSEIRDKFVVVGKRVTFEGLCDLCAKHQNS